MAIQDSGQRREFSTGAVRDIADGKGRMDLVPLDILGQYIGHRLHFDFKSDYIQLVLTFLEKFIETGKQSYLYDAIKYFKIGSGFKDDSQLILELSKHFEEGATKYGENNWRKGIPTHCYLDSALRHLIKWYYDWEDERHDRAFVWNIFCLLWTLEHHPEMDDIDHEGLAGK